MTQSQGRRRGIADLGLGTGKCRVENAKCRMKCPDGTNGSAWRKSGVNVTELIHSECSFVKNLTLQNLAEPCRSLQNLVKPCSDMREKQELMWWRKERGKSGVAGLPIWDWRLRFLAGIQRVGACPMSTMLKWRAEPPCSTLAPQSIGLQREGKKSSRRNPVVICVVDLIFQLFQISNAESLAENREGCRVLPGQRGLVSLKNAEKRRFLCDGTVEHEHGWTQISPMPGFSRQGREGRREGR